jgi:hypothetical protein
MTKRKTYRSNKRTHNVKVSHGCAPVQCREPVLVDSLCGRSCVWRKPYSIRLSAITLSLHTCCRLAKRARRRGDERT